MKIMKVMRFWGLGLFSVSLASHAFADGLSPTVQPAAPALQPKGSSTTKAVSKIKNPKSAGHSLRIGADFFFSPDFADYRGVPPPNLDLNPSNPVSSTPTVAPPAPNLRIVETEFHASTALYRDPYQSYGLRVGMPIRNLSGGNANQTSTGSELGGVSVDVDSAVLGVLNLKLGYALRQSPLFSLIGRHHELNAGVYLGSSENFGGDGALGIEAGPEFVGVVNDPSVAGLGYQYGPQWGFASRVIFESPKGAWGQVRMSFQAMLRRVTDWKVDGISQGGGGLISVTPSFEYLVVDGVWVGLNYQMPIARPEGREGVFGDTRLAGLYGKSIGFSLRASAF